MLHIQAIQQCVYILNVYCPTTVEREQFT